MSFKRPIIATFDWKWFRFTFYLVVLAGFVWCFITPPFQVADENFHFLRAYQVATGGFIPQRLELGQLDTQQIPAYFSDEMFIYRFQRLDAGAGSSIPKSFLLHGGYLRADIPELSNYLLGKIPHDPAQKLSVRKLLQVFRNGQFSGDQVAFVSFPNTAAYSAVAYMPQTAGILIAKAAHLPMIYSFYFARISAVLFGAAIIALGVAIVPWGKPWFCFTALIPMVTFQMASCSADAAVIAFSFLFIAVVLALSEQSVPKTALVAFTGGLWTLLFLTKTVYAALCLLLVPIIWRQRHRLTKYPGILVFPFFILCSFPGFLWALQAMKSFVVPASYLMAEPNAQKDFIIHNSSYAVVSMLTGLRDNALEWFQQGTGVFGWLDTHSPPFYYLLCLLGLTGFIFTDAPRKKDFLLMTCSLVTALTLYLLIAFSIAMIWNPVGVMMVNGIQGRYLLPIIPCLAIFIRISLPGAIPLPPKTVKIALLVLLLTIHGIAVNTMLHRYWVF